jgi:hypothetical protein
MTIPEHKNRVFNLLRGPIGDELMLSQYGRIAKAIEQSHTHEQLREIGRELSKHALVSK